MNSDGGWRVILDGVSEDNIILSILANGKILPNVKLEVKAKEVSKNDDPFGASGL